MIRHRHVTLADKDTALDHLAGLLSDAEIGISGEPQVSRSVDTAPRMDHLTQQIYEHETGETFTARVKMSVDQVGAVPLPSAVSKAFGANDQEAVANMVERLVDENRVPKMVGKAKREVGEDHDVNLRDADIDVERPKASIEREGDNVRIARLLVPLVLTSKFKTGSDWRLNEEALDADLDDDRRRRGNTDTFLAMTR